MQLDHLALALRARNSWEAFDLGLALARRAGRALYLPFVLPYAGFALLVNLASFGHPGLAALIVWWFKPLFDRIALAVLAQSVFGTTPDWRTTLRQWRSIPRTGLLAALTFDRFDFARSFHLPISQLEGQQGRARRERRVLLDKRVRSHAVWLAVVMVHFIYVLILGLDGLLRLLAPMGAQLDLRLDGLFAVASDGADALMAAYLFNAAYLAAECVLEPLYVAAGFTLYLSRRTALEGWDLEIAFKRLAARARAAAPAALLLIVAWLAADLFGGQGAWAQAVAPPAQHGNVAAEKQAITEVLGAPDFRQQENTTRWRRKGSAAPDSPATGQPDANLDFWIRLARIFAEVLRVLAWCAAIAGAGWLLYLASRHWGWLRGAPAIPAPYRPEVLFGFDLRPGSLPDDIAGAARTRLAAGDARAALSLLYRGALRVLIHQRRLEVHAGDTEGDCVRRLGRVAPADQTAFFAGLVRAWGLTAYAGRTPASVTIEALIAAWPAHFAPPASGTAP